MPRGPFLSLDETTQWLAEALEDQVAGSEWAFAIMHLATGRAIGSTRYWKLLFHATGAIEIGYTWITPAHWRTAVNTESKYLLLQHAFERLGVLRVQLMTDARNVRSQQAIERLGAVKEGVLRCHRIPPDGYRRSSVIYSIIDEEWPRVKARLEAALTRS
jgi:RimJ/RimL family protein N-acetyltransferase